MIQTSQLKDELKKSGLDRVFLDSPLGHKAQEFFESAQTKLDPSIYKGASRPYTGKSEVNESYSQLEERMREKSESLQDWMGKERSSIEQKLPPGQRGYDFNRDTASQKGYDFSTSFEDVAKQYLMGEGKELHSYLTSKGRSFYEITRIGTADLEGAVAALAVYGNEAALLGAKDFNAKVSVLAGQHGLSKQEAIKYVLSHEFVHAAQKGKGFDDHIQAELDVELTLKDYFKEKGDYKLAEVASERASSVTSNYRSVGDYAMPKDAKLGPRGSYTSLAGKAGGDPGAYSKSAPAVGSAYSKSAPAIGTAYGKAACAN